MPKKRTKAEFVALLGQVLTHPECPGIVWKYITDALIEMQNMGPTPWASKEYIRYALRCGENCPEESEAVEDLTFEPAESDSEWPALKLIKGVQ
jgi:hypothetical protein